MTIDRKYLTSGRAVFTVRVPEAFRRGRDGLAERYTYQVESPAAGGSGRAAGYLAALSGQPLLQENGVAGRFRVCLLADNDLPDGVELGSLSEEAGEASFQAAESFSPQSWPCLLFARVVKRVWKNEVAQVFSTGFFVHAG